jgi:hypothetical protein
MKTPLESYELFETMRGELDQSLQPDEQKAQPEISLAATL